MASIVHSKNEIVSSVYILEKPCDCKKNIELLGAWIKDVKKLSENGASENLTRFQSLIASFPIAPYMPEEIVHLRAKLVEIVLDKKAYASTLEKIADTALAAFERQYNAAT